MFHAIIIVCALNLNLKIDQSNCISFQDTWGPYRTEENCKIRTDQMIEFFSESSSVKPYITAMLGYPPYVYTTGYCQEPEGAPV